MLGFVQGQTGIVFPKDATFYLIDVFDLVIHMMIRAVEVLISSGQYSSAECNRSRASYQRRLES
ncbi:hypothetical protein [Dyadobacter sp. MSC1_007]|uniref:hypothetical protein n=1 Tax=Dyadobacter sp. MSC1_007 TaxID=2909264 RepID=UPI00202F72A7|nr:hypothetical protein [Dyadobacter sp. MSC1_007]